MESKEILRYLLFAIIGYLFALYVDKYLCRCDGFRIGSINSDEEEPDEPITCRDLNHGEHNTTEKCCKGEEDYNFKECSEIDIDYIGGNIVQPTACEECIHPDHIDHTCTIRRSCMRDSEINDGGEVGLDCYDSLSCESIPEDNDINCNNTYITRVDGTHIKCKFNRGQTRCIDVPHQPNIIQLAQEIDQLANQLALDDNDEFQEINQAIQEIEQNMQLLLANAQAALNA